MSLCLRRARPSAWTLHCAPRPRLAQRWYMCADAEPRTNSQKPNEELLQNFRATFPHLANTTRSQSLTNVEGPSLTDALDVAQTAR